MKKTLIRMASLFVLAILRQMVFAGLRNQDPLPSVMLPSKWDWMNC